MKTIQRALLWRNLSQSGTEYFTDGFAAEIEVDDLNLVRRYSDGWECHSVL